MLITLSLSLLTLTGVAQAGALPPRAPITAAPSGSFDYYHFYVQDYHPQLRVTVTQVSGTEADLYLRRGALPTLAAWDARAATPGTANEALVLNQATTPFLDSGDWYIGVWHGASTNYDVGYKAEAVPSLHAGMGAAPYDDAGRTGTAFRVWAPNANKVHLSGAFNGWYATSAPLAAEGGGNWSLDVRNLGHGARYRYVLDTAAGQLWKNDPRAKRLTNSTGDSIVVDPAAYSWSGGGYATPPWNELVVYETHVGTFNPSNGVPPGGFAEVELRLDYLADLGVNAIELMPICEFPLNLSWGYNYGHPYSVESAYGEPEQLKRLIDQAHQRGLAVLLDVTYNHWGPNDMDLWRFDGWGLANWGGIYFYNDQRAVTPWGDTRPDYGRGEVRRYIRDNALGWLQEYRFDGLRWDSTSFMRTGPWGDIPDAWSLMQWVNDEIDLLQGWKISIAEDMWTNEWITRDSGAGGAGFDSQWSAEFVHPIRNEIIIPDDNARSMWAVRDAVAFYFNGDAFQRVVYTESHDEAANGKSRVPEAIWPGNAGSWYSKKRSTLGAALVMTSPGIPMILQGQELLEDGWFSDADPVDWNKLNLYGGIHDLYRELIRLRRDWYDNSAGLKGNHLNVHHVNDGDKMIAFHRWDQGGPGDDVIVIANFRNRSWSSYNVGLPRGGVWRLRFNSDWNGYDPSFGNHPSGDVTAQNFGWDGMPYTGTITIAPYSVLIYSQ